MPQSGFGRMMVDDLGRIPMSQHLAATLTRAASYADAQSHPEVRLEHLLLALAEDPDAASVLRSSNVDLARLAGEVSIHIGQIEDRRAPDGPSQVLISPDLRRILEAAAAAARQGRRSEINGAIVLAAIVGDGKSTAAHLLRAQGMTFEHAIRALRAAAAAPRPAPPEPAPAHAASGSTDEILASARERVPSRSAPASSPVLPPVSAPAQPVPPPQHPALEPLAHGQPQRSPLAPQWEPAAVPPPRAPQPGDGSPAAHAPQGRFGAPPAPSMPAPSMPTSAPGPMPPPMQRTQPPSAPAPVGPRTGPPPQFPMPPQGGPAGGGQPPMRPPQMQRAPQPAQPPGADPRAPARPPQPRPRSGGGTVRVAAGQLVENIPRRMRVGVAMVVEARLARAEVKAIAEGLQDGGAVYRHEVTVTKAMSVRLRAPDGGFFIETSSPETQWIENVLGLMADDFASWRWTITPRERGKQRLQLLISARTVGADGLTAETALPDQVIEVKVGVNYAKTAVRWAGWMTAAVIGGILARFGEGLFIPLITILRGS